MDSVDWKSRGAEPPTRDAQILPARPSHGSRMLARKLTSVQPSATQDLRFINLSHPDDLHRQKEVRTEIRRHVMKDIGQRRRRPQPNATSSQATRTFSSESNGYKISQLRGAIINSVSPSQNLAMLAHFPVEADMRALELMHSVVTGPYQPFRGVWIEVALCDPGAFHVTLGNAADFLNKINGNQSVKSPEALSHFEISTRKLRQRLNNFTESISEGAIANILAHVCLTMRHCDWDSWSIHMDGLSLIAKLRGGFADLGHRMSLLILLYDLAGAMVFDSYPRFGLPAEFVGISNISSRGLAPRLQALLVQPISPAFFPAGQALTMVSSIADVINTTSHSASFWKRDIDAIRLIGPCIHFLLSMPRFPSNFEAMADPEDLIARELVRLTCLMLMSKLKGQFAFPPSELVSLPARLAEFVPPNVKRLGKKYFELKIWALVTIALLRYCDGREVYIQEMKREMSAMEKATPYEITGIARDIVWIDILMSPFSEELAADMKLHVTPQGTC